MIGLNEVKKQLGFENSPSYIGGSEVWKLRHRLRLSQRELGELCGMSQANISAIESDRRKLSLSTLTKIAKATKTRLRISFEE